MLIYPMVEFARIVETSPWASSTTYDGETFADKALAYVEAAEASVAAHEFEWDDAGFYRFAADASFLDYAGEDEPLNQSNAMGRALVILAELTGDPEHAAKAAALAARLKAQMIVGGAGEYLWNYWGGPYSGDGEDISHAAINVDFAALAAERGIVFTAADVDRLAATFSARVYIDDGAFHDHVGGGSINGDGYRPQVGRWLRVSRARPIVYTAVRDLFEADYPPATVGSGATLLGWAHLAEYEPPHCPHFFYSVDWEAQGEWREATAYGANVLTTPIELSAPCMVPVEVEVPRPTTVAQWDGDAYHRVASWPAAAATVRRLAFDPRWPFVYWQDGALFQFEDKFVEGDGIRVHEPVEWVAPKITSTPPTSAEIDGPLGYVLAGEGEPPIWWRLVDGPADARLDPGSGALAWTPAADGLYAFTVRLESEAGDVEQMFTVEVGVAATTGDPSDGSTSDDGTSGSGGPSESDSDASTDGGATTEPTTGATTGSTSGAGVDAATTSDGAGEDEGAGCGCRGASTGGAPLLGVALLGLRRRRAKSRQGRF
ncbi:MAG: hypothetical protein R3B09_09190 [Nannocystaceae bacterium]